VTDASERPRTLAPSDQRLAGYLFWLSRPRFWFYLAGPVVVGVAYGASTTTDFFTPLTIALFLYFLLPANIFLYGINDIFDAEIDQLNPKKSEEGKEVRFEGGRAVIGAVGLSAAAALAFVPALPPGSLLALGAFIVLGTAYSAPPLRLKTTPLLDSISNGLYIMPGIVAYGAVAGELPPLLMIAGGWLWTMGMHTFSAIPDIEPDRKAGIQTTATALGEYRTYWYCAGCWLLAAVLVGSVHPFFAAVFAIYPVFVAVIVLASIEANRAYWWFPIVNVLAGTVLTLGAIRVVLHG